MFARFTSRKRNGNACTSCTALRRNRARPSAERRTSGSVPGAAPFLVEKSFRQNSLSGNQEFMRDPKLLFCRKNNWNQGKANCIVYMIHEHFAERTIGIKAKQRQTNDPEEMILPKEQLESRQSLQYWGGNDIRILPKEQLESRQSVRHAGELLRPILPKEQLESRQSAAAL